MLEGRDYAEAANPATEQDRLRELSRHPELQPLIAANPSTYPALRDWIGTQGQVAPIRTDSESLSVTPAEDFSRVSPPGRYDGLAISALIAAIIVPPVGVILGAVARSRHRSKLATTSIALGAVFTLTLSSTIVGGALLIGKLQHDAQVMAFCVASADNLLIGNDGWTDPFREVSESDRPAFINANRAEIETWKSDFDALARAVPERDAEGLADTMYGASLALSDILGSAATEGDLWQNLEEGLGNSTGWRTRNCA